MAWATAKGTLRVAVVGFDRESTALWEGSTPMLPYTGNMYDPLIAADDRTSASYPNTISKRSRGKALKRSAMPS
jgi:hypothetical protein